MERLLLLDGNGLIYRGYFALIEQPLTTSKGELVTAVFGFTNIVLRAIQDAKPDRLGVAFDLGKPAKLPEVTMASPHVRLLGEDAAVISKWCEPGRMCC